MATSSTVTVHFLDARIEGNALQVLQRIERHESWSTILEAGVPREDGLIIAQGALPGLLADLRKRIEEGLDLEAIGEK